MKRKIKEFLTKRRNKRALKKLRKTYGYIYTKQLDMAHTKYGWAYISLSRNIQKAYTEFIKTIKDEET